MKRIVVLFMIAQLLLLTVFCLALISYPDLDLFALQREDTTIQIIGSNRTNHELTLNPSITVPAYAGKKVIWKLADSAPDVRTFDVEPKSGQPAVFKCDPPVGNKRRPAVGYLRGRMNTIEYSYSIHWVDRDGNPHRHDPKIAIRPGNDFGLLIYILLYGLLAFVISYMTFRKQRSSETHPT